jgi:hypothetical protein
VRGALCATDLARPSNTADALIRKGQKFQVVEVTGEGGCNIEFATSKYGLGSCPWDPGFQDRQSDIFVVVKIPGQKQGKHECPQFAG